MNKFLKAFVDEHFDQPRKALDLGAGDFSDIEALKKAGWQGEGVDIKNGVDLEKPYQSPSSPFDLVYANYVIHFIDNKRQFIQTAVNNLKTGGWLFLHTFDKSDKVSRSTLDEISVRKLIDGDFINVSTKVFDLFDDEVGHKHWHRVLEVSAQKA